MQQMRLEEVTGVSVVDNIVAVRGLGDRYTNTQLNNSDLATPEPEKELFL